jgi:hypothetical protein
VSTSASIAVAVVGGLVGSAPGWATIYLGQRRALNRQTVELKSATAAQTEDFKTVTARQTTEIKEHLGTQNSDSGP